MNIAPRFILKRTFIWRSFLARNIEFLVLEDNGRYRWQELHSLGNAESGYLGSQHEPSYLRREGLSKCRRGRTGIYQILRRKDACQNAVRKKKKIGQAFFDSRKNISLYFWREAKHSWQQESFRNRIQKCSIMISKWNPTYKATRAHWQKWTSAYIAVPSCLVLL